MACPLFKVVVVVVGGGGGSAGLPLLVFGPQWACLWARGHAGLLVPAFGPHTACPLPGLAGLATVGLRAAAGLLLGSRACGFASVGLRVAEVLPLARACGPCHCWHSGRSWCCLSLEWLACPCWPPGHSRLASTARATAGLPPLLVRVPPPQCWWQKTACLYSVEARGPGSLSQFYFFRA